MSRMDLDCIFFRLETLLITTCRTRPPHGHAARSVLAPDASFLPISVSQVCDCAFGASSPDLAPAAPSANLFARRWPRPLLAEVAGAPKCTVQCKVRAETMRA